MNDETESRNTMWGLIAGVSCVALLMFYAVGTGAMQGSSRARTCSSCQRAGDAPQSFVGSGTSLNTNP